MHESALELHEGQDLLIPAGDLERSHAVALSQSGYVEVAFPGVENEFRLRSKGHIGYIPIDPDFVVRIVPKTPIANLFRLLEVVYNLKSFELFSGEVALASVEDFFERVAHILTRRILDRARRGLYRGYIDRKDDMSVVRGRIDVRRTSVNVLRATPLICCEFQEQTEDLADNQILLWTMHQISHMPISRAEVRADVRCAYRILRGCVSLAEMTRDDCLGRNYSRLNEDYRLLHGLCHLFLSDLGPGMTTGSAAMLPFAMNMPILFQDFVAAWLKGNIGSEFVVRSQHAMQVWDTTARADVVLLDAKTRKPVAVLDMKYKIGSAPSTDDIAQVMMYAVQLGVKNAFLVYPSAMAGRCEDSFGKDFRVKVRTVHFDLARDVAAEGARFIVDLRASLTSPE